MALAELSEIGNLSGMAQKAHLHIDFVMVSIAIVAIIATGAVTAETFRGFSATLGVACVVGLSYRLVATWTLVSRLTKVLSLLLLANLAMGSLAQYLLVMDDGSAVPSNAGTALVFAVRIAILLVALFWNHLLEASVQRNRSHQGQRLMTFSH